MMLSKDSTPINQDRQSLYCQCSYGLWFARHCYGWITSLWTINWEISYVTYRVALSSNLWALSSCVTRWAKDISPLLTFVHDSLSLFIENSWHAIIVTGDNPMDRDGVTSLFYTWKPTVQEYETCPHYELTFEMLWYPLGWTTSCYLCMVYANRGRFFPCDTYIRCTSFIQFPKLWWMLQRRILLAANWIYY